MNNNESKFIVNLTKYILNKNKLNVDDFQVKVMKD
jgi:hypothetical protein